MKLKIKITKSVIDRSLNCGTDGRSISQSCGIAVAIRDLFPKAAIWGEDWTSNTSLSCQFIKSTEDMKDFVIEFDSYLGDVQKLYSLVGKEFEIDIPDEIIDEIGISQATQIINTSESLELVSQ
jgi:hypothetical protein